MNTRKLNRAKKLSAVSKVSNFGQDALFNQSLSTLYRYLMAGEDILYSKLSQSPPKSKGNNSNSLRGLREWLRKEFQPVQKPFHIICRVEEGLCPIPIDLITVFDVILTGRPNQSKTTVLLSMGIRRHLTFCKIEFYTIYRRRVDGLKFQSVVIPNGLTANLAGPFEGRRQDSI